MLFLDRSDVAALLSMPECIEAMAGAFAAHAAGELPAPPGVLGSYVPGGGFHVKTAALGGAPGFYAAKVNANFPGNPERHGMPTIQGIIGLFDTATGRPARPARLNRDHDASHGRGERARRAPARPAGCVDLAHLRLRQPGPGPPARHDAGAAPAARARP